MKLSYLLTVAVAGVMAAPSLLGQAQSCDRACLEGFVDQYMDALIAHKPSQLATATRVKNTEDGVRLELGDGFWRTAKGKGKYRLFNADPETGQVVFFGTMQEEPNLGVLVMIRLKVVDRKVAEIENFVVRDAAAAKRVEDMGQPNAVFASVIPAAQRATRAALIQTVNAYFSGIEKNNGKGDYSFLAPDCVRVQNGTQTTKNADAWKDFVPQVSATGGRGKGNPPPAPVAPEPNIFGLGCQDQFKTGYYGFVTRVRDRRFVVVDRERGLVTAIAAMDMPAGKYRKVVVNGKQVEAGGDKPTTLALAETFKIEGGKIRRVEAVQLNVPYGMVTAQSTWEDGMSSKAQDVK
jgi:hypothetical protein